MTLTPEQFDALCEAAEHADDKTMFNVRAVVNAILPLYRAMVLEEVVDLIESLRDYKQGGSLSEPEEDQTDFYVNQIKALAIQETKP